MAPDEASTDDLAVRLRRVVLIVAGINFAYFFVQFAIALYAGSVSLLADSVDFLEDTAVNALIFVALGWPLARRSIMGKVMAGIIVVPSVFAIVQAVRAFLDPTPPLVVPLVLGSLGAIVINGVSALLLVRVRNAQGSLSKAAYLSARNDVAVNVAVIAMGLLTVATGSGWPDIVLGCAIIALMGRAAWEVWELSEEERLAAKALAGEDLD